jgi:cytochrome P450
MTQPEIDPTTLPHPPGPGGVAVLGSFLRLAQDPLAFMKIVASHGTVVRVRIGPERLVFLTDPAIIHEVLVGRASEMVKDRITQKLNETMGNGLLTSEGSFWRRQRKTMAPLFKRKQLAAYAEVMTDRTEMAIAGWQDGQELDLHTASMALTLDIIFRTVFGSEMDAGAAEKVAHAIDWMMDQFEKELRTWRRFVPQAWLVLGRSRTRHARATLDAIVYALIAQKREAGADGDDLVSRLLAARADDGSAMSDLQVRDEAVTMVVAGHETTALVLTFSAMLLSDHPQVAATLRAELDTVLRGRSPRLEDLPLLPFCKAVVLEAMRLFPPAYVIGRQVEQPIALGGFRIDPGDQLLIPQWVLHHDARWFDRPAEFDPARWLDGLEERLPEHAYLPFGGGPRVCIGQHFAMMEAVLCLATMALRVEWSVLPGQSRALSPAVTLRPKHGMRVVVRKRTPDPLADRPSPDVAVVPL